MKITVVDTGYVGLVTAVCMAEKRHQVTCLDIDAKKIEMLRNGCSPICEQGLTHLIEKNREHLDYITDGASAYQDADVIIIGVGTPEKLDGSANLEYVFSTAEQIASVVEKDCVVVLKSTVPVGTSDRLEGIINKKKRRNVMITVASNPEFLAQGSAVQDTLYSSRIIIGIEDKKIEDVILELYKDFEAPKLMMDRWSAEMVKYTSNDFLALKISYINEIANRCEQVGANIKAVTEGMGYDQRIGPHFLHVGIGYGGSCFPKDTKALHWLAKTHDIKLRTIKATIEVNEQQKYCFIKKARSYYESFAELRIAVLGLSFKPRTDDLREAPSLINISILLEEKVIVKVWDPVASENYKKIYPTQITYCRNIDEAINGTDMCFVLTEWEDIKKYDSNRFSQLMKHPIVLDGRNCTDLKKLAKGSSLVYEGIGVRPFGKWEKT